MGHEPGDRDRKIKGKDERRKEIRESSRRNEMSEWTSKLGKKMGGEGGKVGELEVRAEGDEKQLPLRRGDDRLPAG